MATSDHSKEKLSSKLSQIALEIGKVAKSGKNDKQGYAFVEYAVVAGKIRQAFYDYGVMIYPELEDYSMEHITNAKGNSGYHYVLQMKFRIVNTDDPEDFIERKWCGEAADYGDKGINKAITSASKYFLMRLLNISEKGDEDPDLTTPEIRSQSAAPSSKPPSEKQLEYLLKLLLEDGQEVTMDDLKEKIKTAAMASATIEKYANK